MPETITSASNAVIKRARKLRLRKHRERERVFLVEGISQVWRAVDHGARVDTLLVALDLLTSGPALEWIERQEQNGTRVAYLSRELFESVTERDHPSGLGAIVEMRGTGLEDLVVESESVFIVLVDVGNPGNLGSILRTVDAVRGAGLILVGDTTDQFHPSAVKASMGALFTVPVARGRSLDEIFDWAEEHHVSTVTTSARAHNEYWQGRFDTPCALILGSEAEGLSDRDLARGAESVRIPMEGDVTSLNLAVAAGVLLYEVKRRTRMSELGAERP